MASMFKRPIDTDDVLFILGIRLFELIEYLCFFQTGFVPEQSLEDGSKKWLYGAHMDS